MAEQDLGEITESYKGQKVVESRDHLRPEGGGDTAHEKKPTEKLILTMIY